MLFFIDVLLFSTLYKWMKKCQRKGFYMRKEPDGFFDKFKELSENEDWKDGATEWKRTINKLTTELRNLDLDHLQKEKLEAQANLRYSELRNENSAIKYGLPIVSLILSVIAIATSIIPTLADLLKTTESNTEVLTEKAINFVLCFMCVFLVLVGMVILIYFVYAICERYRNNRQKEIVYYQTKIKIIEIVEDEKKSNGNKRVATGNKKCYVVEVEEKHSDF